jgi:hypothetical protein
MEIDKNNYEYLQNDKRVKREIKKLKKIYEDIPAEQAKLVLRLIENAGFMAVLLEDLQNDIKANGYKEEYKNGANQFGFKRSISADLYQVTIKNYSAIIRQLNDLLPSEAFEVDDGFDAFVRSRDEMV